MGPRGSVATGLTPSRLPPRPPHDGGPSLPTPVVDPGGPRAWFTRDLPQRGASAVTGLYRSVFREDPGRFATALARGIAILATAEVVAGVVAFPVRALAGRALGAEEFGRYSVVMSLVQFLVWPMLLSVPTAALRFLPAEPERADDLVSAMAITTTIATAVSVVGLWMTRSWWMGRVGLGADLLPWTLALAAAVATHNLWESVVRGLHRYRILALGSLLGAGTLLAAFAATVFVWHAHDAQGLIGATLLSVLVPAGLFVVRVARGGVRFRRRLETAPRVLAYSGVATLGGLTGAVITAADRLILQRYVPLEEVGVYAAHVTAASLVAGKALQWWVSVFFPTIAGERQKVVILARLRGAYALAVGPLFGCSLASIVAIVWLLGKEFPLRWGLAVLLAINACLVGFYQMYMWLLNAEGMRGLRAVIGVLAAHALVTAVLLALLVPGFGALGAGLASVVVSASLCVAFHRLAWSFARRGILT